ncbi:MAG TPA: cell wall hydrolase [Candidatus Paceibacterota bacterium]
MRYVPSVRTLSSLMTGVLFVSFVAYFVHVQQKKEYAVMCLAENLYHEARGELRVHQYLIGIIVIARVTDPSPEWPKTICGAVAQERQFSWVLDHRLATKRNERKKWEEAQFVARDLIENAWRAYLLPRGWQCVRWYKRTDGKGVSKAGQTFFDTRLFPVGQFGRHTAYRSKRGCSSPLPTT